MLLRVVRGEESRHTIPPIGPGVKTGGVRIRERSGPGLGAPDRTAVLVDGLANGQQTDRSRRAVRFAVRD